MNEAQLLKELENDYTPEQKNCHHVCVRLGEGHIGFCACKLCKAVGKFE